MNPPKDNNSEDKPDPALIDRFYCILMQREMDSKVKAHWVESLNKDARFCRIREKRPTTSPEQIAKELDVSLEQFYYLEREMLKAYYASSDYIRKHQ